MIEIQFFLAYIHDSQAVLSCSALVRQSRAACTCALSLSPYFFYSIVRRVIGNFSLFKTLLYSCWFGKKRADANVESSLKYSKRGCQKIKLVYSLAPRPPLPVLNLLPRPLLYTERLHFSTNSTQQAHQQAKQEQQQRVWVEKRKTLLDMAERKR